MTIEISNRREIQVTELICSFFLMVKAGDWLCAYELLNAAKEIEPNHPYVLAAQEGICELSGHYEEAEQYVNKILEQVPASYNTLIKKGELCLLRNNVGEAIEWFSKALQTGDISNDQVFPLKGPVELM